MWNFDSIGKVWRQHIICASKCTWRLQTPYLKNNIFVMTSINTWIYKIIRLLLGQPSATCQGQKREEEEIEDLLPDEQQR